MASASSAPAPLPPVTFHIPFFGHAHGSPSGHRGCCADINAITEHAGVKHLFKQSGGVEDPTSKGLGFAHYISDDFVRWKYLSTIVTPGGADGSLSFGLPGGPVILWDCGDEEACMPSRDIGLAAGGCKSGDRAIIGVARPANASDPTLEHWVKDAKNPIVVHQGSGLASCYAGPSNLWVSSDKKTTYLEMIFNKTTGLFKSTDLDLHSWDLVNGDFYATRGGGGGLFFALPRPASSPLGDVLSYSHMLQSDFPGHADGTAFYALGSYDEAKGTFTGVSNEPRALDFSENFVYNQLGTRADGTMVNVGWIRNMGTSVVRDVSYDLALGGQLLAYPVPELTTLRTAVLGSTGGKNVTLPRTTNTSIVASGATAADMDLVFGIAPQGLEVTVTALGFAVDLTVQAGGSNATLRVSSVAGSCLGSFPLPPGLEQIALRLLVDGVSIEAFAAEGRGVCSFADIVAPIQSAVVVTAGSLPVTLLNATVWKMGAILDGES